MKEYKVIIGSKFSHKTDITYREMTDEELSKIKTFYKQLDIPLTIFPL